MFLVMLFLRVMVLDVVILVFLLLILVIVDLSVVLMFLSEEFGGIGMIVRLSCGIMFGEVVEKRLLLVVGFLVKFVG